jgi:hypothetical protein
MENEKTNNPDLTNDHKIVVSVAGTGDRLPMLLVGIPKKAIEVLLSGKTHNIDLVSLGVPLRVILFWCRDSETGTAAIKKSLDDAVNGFKLNYKGPSPNDFKIDPDVAAGRDRMKSGETARGEIDRLPQSNHPNLSDDINANIARSEILGGLKVSDIRLDQTIHVQTRNTLYKIKRDIDSLYIIGHPEFCPVWTRCDIHGSTFGGSMIKLDWIGREMHLEFSTDVHAGSIVTSAIQDIYE